MNHWKAKFLQKLFLNNISAMLRNKNRKKKGKLSFSVSVLFRLLRNIISFVCGQL